VLFSSFASVAGSSDRMRLLSCACSFQLVFYLVKHSAFSFHAGPPLNLREIDRICRCHELGLLQTFRVVVVIIPGESIFHAVGWRENPKYARCGFNLGNLLHGFFADRKRSRRKFNEKRTVGMPEVAVLFVKTQTLHCLLDQRTFRKGRIDEIKIHGNIFPMAVNGNTGTAGKNHRCCGGETQRPQTRQTPGAACWLRIS